MPDGLLDSMDHHSLHDLNCTSLLYPNCQVLNRGKVSEVPSLGPMSQPVGRWNAMKVARVQCPGDHLANDGATRRLPLPPPSRGRRSGEAGEPPILSRVSPISPVTCLPTPHRAASLHITDRSSHVVLSYRPPVRALSQEPNR